MLLTMILWPCARHSLWYNSCRCATTLANWSSVVQCFNIGLVRRRPLDWD